MSPDGASHTKLKAFLQECMDVVGVEDTSQLLSALRKYRRDQDIIKNICILSEKVTEFRKALQNVVDAANPIVDGVMAAAAVGTPRRSGGSNPGKKGMITEKWRKERESESASIHHPSSHIAPSNKLRLDDE